MTDPRWVPPCRSREFPPAACCGANSSPSFPCATTLRKVTGDTHVPTFDPEVSPRALRAARRGAVRRADVPGCPEPACGGRVEHIAVAGAHDRRHARCAAGPHGFGEHLARVRIRIVEFERTGQVQLRWPAEVLRL